LPPIVRNEERLVQDVHARPAPARLASLATRGPRREESASFTRAEGVDPVGARSDFACCSRARSRTPRSARASRTILLDLTKRRRGPPPPPPRRRGRLQRVVLERARAAMPGRARVGEVGDGGGSRAPRSRASGRWCGRDRGGVSTDIGGAGDGARARARRRRGAGRDGSSAGAHERVQRGTGAVLANESGARRAAGRRPPGPRGARRQVPPRGVNQRIQ